jgi:hypothetical protein
LRLVKVETTSSREITLHIRFGHLTALLLQVERFLVGHLVYPCLADSISLGGQFFETVIEAELLSLFVPLRQHLLQLSPSAIVNIRQTDLRHEVVHLGRALLLVPGLYLFVAVAAHGERFARGLAQLCLLVCIHLLRVEGRI